MTERDSKLRGFFRGTYRPLRLRGRSADTARLYENTITQFERFLERPSTLDDLDELVLSRYLEHRGEKRSPYTAEKERNQLMALARCAWERRLIDVMPSVPPSRLPTRVPTAWSVEQLRSLVTHAKIAKGRIGDVNACVWWPALIMTLWQSAERIGAIMSLTKADYTRPMILVRAEYRKGGKRDKLYRLSDETCDMLDVLVESGNGDQLFAWPLDKLYLWQRFGKLIDAAGLGGGKRCKFHQLRRSAATHFLAAGGDPTSLLDHSSPRITKAYIDPRFIDSGPKPCDILPQIN